MLNGLAEVIMSMTNLRKSASPSHGLKQRTRICDENGEPNLDSSSGTDAKIKLTSCGSSHFGTCIGGREIQVYSAGAVSMALAKGRD
jgi:hypothetical protein